MKTIIKTQVSVHMQEFVSEEQIIGRLQEFGIEPSYLKIKEQHKAAYGIPAYQIVEIDIESGLKFNKL